MSQAGNAGAPSTLRTGSSSSAASAPSAPQSSKLTVGPRCIIAQDTDIKGNVTIGSGTVIHPKAVIHVLHDGEGASIVIGNDCIIEELVQIVHSGKGTMVIGNANLFEVGCRIEAASIGSHNTFQCKSRVLDSVAIGDFCTIGKACIAQPPLDWDMDGQSTGAEAAPVFSLPAQSVIYGIDSQIRQWSGRGVRQSDALHTKHLDHLRRNLPEFHKLRIIE